MYSFPKKSHKQSTISIHFSRKMVNWVGISRHLAITNLRLFCREEDCRFLEQRIAAEKGRCARLEEELKEAQRLLKAGEESRFAAFFSFKW